MTDQRTHRWTELRSPELAALAQADALVLLPVGSMEQHGPHLPVDTDSLLAETVSLHAAGLLATAHPVVVGPTVWTGMSEHHMRFAGTITLSFDTFAAVLRDVCRSIQRHGFTRIMLVNGHGGHQAPLQVLVGELSQSLAHPVQALTYWALDASKQAYGGILTDQTRVLHACEAETSMVLAIAPASVDEATMLSAPNAPFTRLPDPGVYQYSGFHEFTQTGVNGVTKNASASKGGALLEASAQAVAQAVRTQFGL
jgi:creatinine amidohydrolase